MFQSVFKFIVTNVVDRVRVSVCSVIEQSHFGGAIPSNKPSHIQDHSQSSCLLLPCYHHIPIKTKALAPKVEWSVIGLNKPQRQTESSVACRSANDLSTAFCLQPTNPPAPKSAFSTPLLLYLHTQNSCKKW